MRIAIVAHHSRRHMAARLEAQVSADIVFMDESRHGAAWNHHRAIEWASHQDGPVAILEDDAVPVSRFTELAERWHERFPKHLVSLYLGTGRPPQWQPVIDREIASIDGDWISLDQLIHGVAYMADANTFRAIYPVMRLAGAADYIIGDAYLQTSNLPVIYPKRSLVDHADIGTIERHPDGAKRTEPRKARELETT